MSIQPFGLVGKVQSLSRFVTIFRDLASGGAKFMLKLYVKTGKK